MNRNDCSVYFDRANRRLVYIGRPADEKYWDEHWAETPEVSAVNRFNSFVVTNTRRWLPIGSKILDGGCGLAHTVYSLHQVGYQAYGVDFAVKTVELVNEHAPELNVVPGDVRDLPFAESFLDGYWSIGVIEHFIEGYDAIVEEMRRVLKPGGVAFVTVPSVSPIRKAKIFLNKYPEFDGQYKNFYQFVLNPANIIKSFEFHGFDLLATKPRGGFKGLKDESELLRVPMQRVYDSTSFAGAFP